MADFNTSKVDGNTVAAIEWNQLADLDNFVTTSGQTPSTGNLNQYGIGSARYLSGGQFFTDSGTANAYVLSPVSPFKAPVSATEGYFIGMIIRFRAGNANTGASIVNVNSAGVKNLKKEDGTTDLSAGDIPTTQDSIFRYDGTSFILQTGTASTEKKGVSYLPQQITISSGSDADHYLNFSAGNAQAINGSVVYSVAALTKRIDASFTAGTNQGGLDTGTVANNTPYYCYAIQNLTTGASDILFTASAPNSTTKAYSGANMPSGWGNESYIGACHTDGSANIRNGIWTYGKNHYNFRYNNANIVTDINITSVTTVNRTLYALSCPVKSIAVMTFYVATNNANNGSKNLYLTNNSEADTASNPSIRWSQGAIENMLYSQYYEKQLGTTNELGIRGSASDPDVVVYTQGWNEYL